MLTGVTLTGADDTVSPEELRRLSALYPFVEWGILIGSREGVSRFPSLRWIERLLSEATVPLKLSLHICGGWLRGLLEEEARDWPDAFVTYPPSFTRCQLNFHGEPISDDQCRNLIGHLHRDCPFGSTIVQLDGVNNWALPALLSAGIKAQGLYDTSHGAGVVPESWPPPNPNWSVGYAGGIGPCNVELVIQQLQRLVVDRDFWIDMETRLYSETGKFDPARCESVLCQAAHFIG